MKLIKGFLLAIVVLVVSVFLLGPLVGVPPNYIIHGPNVASGIGSKLLCSARYVSEFSREQARQDLIQYSPILEQLTIEYDDQNQSVTTSLFGIQEKTAKVVPNLGCAVEFEDFHQRQILETQSISKNAAPWPLGNTVTTHSPSLQSLVETLVESDNENGLNTRALLVVHGGQIVAEAYAQETDSQTPLLGWSMAKSLISIALGNLEYRNLLDLNQTSGFGEWQNDSRSQIKIVDLLNMADGLAFSEEYDPGDDATAMLFTEPSAAQYALNMPGIHEPGTHFNYSSGTANLLSQIYTNTLGSPQLAYDDFRENIVVPLGFQSAVFETDASGVFVGSSYFYASARDWARLGQLMLNRGVLNEQRIVSQEWVERAVSPNQTNNGKAYGFQWWLNRGGESLRFESLPEDLFYANGNRQQFVMVFPALNSVIVRLGWTGTRYPVSENFSQILDQL